MSKAILIIDMPECCDECFALDNNGDYPMCSITQEQRGYTFRTREQRMDKCPLKLISENFNMENNMGTIVKEFKTEYNVGDVVIFRKNRKLEVGIIEGYYVDDDIFWFNIRTSEKVVYTYTNHGDVGEHDIIGIVDDKLKEVCSDIITKDLF